MFWLLINHNLKDTERFSEEQLFEKYWIKYQMYVEWQKFLMYRIETMMMETARVTDSTDTFRILFWEFWEMNMAKFFYTVDRDPRIIKDYAHFFYDEMMQQIDDTYKKEQK